ncbi:heavy metal-associated isoprenylated plant protein 12 isoform X2 [Sorghum bicolor]|uniref:heavy metal-associated isoprenylated plant protein 12 isoform X2 n=1 Tax=Sorghum bicolor TaxID=4558 RepID=UPI000B426577|nr:heavy metal-associated isoprenylated plant protein 12 isoform X2 [Sorghum bicolor]|eukprot:XP_021307337.1 heavy metal-associated isoprenylated plant protein 12 isoform X2 [Sorghum bicolor]
MPDSKIVLKVDVLGDGCKAKAMSTVANFQGVKSVAVDGEGTLTVVGEVDVVRVAKALRKARFEARVLSVGPEKQPDNKKPAAAEEAKKPPPCCAGCSACCPPVPAYAHPFPGAVVCYEEQAAAGNVCVIL